MAYDFDGTNDCMERSQPWSITTPLTIAAWFQADTPANLRPIVQVAENAIGGASGTTGNHHCMINLSGTGVFQASAGVNNGRSQSSVGSAVTAGQWYHGCGKFVSSSSRFAYLDGVSGTDAGGTRAAINLDNTILATGSGGTYSLANFFNGKIAEVGVWDVALTDDEIISLAKGIKPIYIRPQNLKTYIPLIREALDVKNGTMTVTQAVAFDHPRIYS